MAKRRGSRGAVKLLDGWGERGREREREFVAAWPPRMFFPAEVSCAVTRKQGKTAELALAPALALK